MDAETTKTIANLTTRIDKLERALILVLHTYLRHKETDSAARPCNAAAQKRRDLAGRREIWSLASLAHRPRQGHDDRRVPFAVDSCVSYFTQRFPRHGHDRRTRL